MKLPFRPALFIALFAALVTTVACGVSEGSDSTPPASPEDTLSVIAMTPLDVGVKTTRLPFVVFLSDEAQTRVDNRLADLTFGFRHSDDQEFKPLTDVEWRAWPVRGGAYVTHPEFDRAGFWEFQVELTEDDGDNRVGATTVEVKQESSAPSIGEPALSTVTKTASTVEEVQQISSAFNPDPEFYSISLDEALTNGRPTIILFSTPAYCNSATCGPQLDTLGEVKALYGDQVNFIHVEIYDNIREMLDAGDSSIGEVAQPVEDWGLISEPWTFFIGADGIVKARFEQFTTFEELNEAAQRLLAQG